MGRRPRFIVFTVAILVVYFALAGLCAINAYFYDTSVPAEEYIKSISIERTDGTVEHYDENYFDAPNKGDVLHVVVNLPRKLANGNKSISFQVYHMVVTVDNHVTEPVVYGKDVNDRGKMVGSLYVQASVPSLVYDHDIDITCVGTEQNSCARLIDFKLVDSSVGKQVFIVRYQSTLYLYVTVLFLSLVALITLIFADPRRKTIRMAIWVSLCAFGLSVYLLSYYGCIVAITGNQRGNAIGEYMGLYLFPAPLVAYYAEWVVDKVKKRILWAIAGCFAAFFVISTLMNFLTEFHYCRYVLPFDIAAAIVALFTIVMVLVDAKKYYRHEAFANKGLIVFIFFAVAEFIRYLFDAVIGVQAFFAESSVLPIGGTIFIAFLVRDCANQIGKMLEEHKNFKELERAAYTDALTGLENRTSYNRAARELTRKGEKNFTVVSIDVNNLKRVNDNLGHEYGDMYLQHISRVIKEQFREATCVARLGGDEFIALYEGKIAKRVSIVISGMFYEIKELNKKKVLPFEMMVACGFAESTDEEPLDIEEAYVIADKRMYADKRRIKGLN